LNDLPFNDLSVRNRANVDICICTYRRRTIIATLQGIAAQQNCDGIAVKVLVADNAAEAEARAVIVKAGEQLGLALRYLHAPANNISIARNACLNAGRGEWIAFLDDDESPTPTWLAELMGEAKRGDWDAVLGPVQALYPETAPQWLRTGDFHSTLPVWKRGQIETGYTGNVLLRRKVIEEHRLQFRPDLGRSGGEDVDFFYRFHDARGRIGFAAKALVYEPVPLERTRLPWLLKRSFRRGQSHGARLSASARGWAGRIVHLPLALAKAAILGLGAALYLPRAARRNLFLTRAVLQCGVAARLAGLAEIKLY
jgi:succinoglycan biosynthesis protein ExoM